MKRLWAVVSETLGIWMRSDPKPVLWWLRNVQILHEELHQPVVYGSLGQSRVKARKVGLSLMGGWFVSVVRGRGRRESKEWAQSANTRLLFE